MDFQTIKLRDGTELQVPMRVPMSCVKGGVGQVGYQVFLQEKTTGIHLHMEAVNRAAKIIYKQSDLETIFHPFGGLGMAAQCLEKTLKREFVHEFWERDPDCYAALRELYPKSVLKLMPDSFTELVAKSPQFFNGFDLVFLDPTAMTVKKEGLWEVWRSLAHAEVPFVWFVDSAISKIWLHTETYTKLFGHEVKNINDYFTQYGRLLNDLGYQVIDLTREGTVVYGLVKLEEHLKLGPVPPIVDLRAP